MGQKKPPVDIAIPKTLAANPVYEQGQAVQMSNLRIQGKVLQSRYGNKKFRTTDLGGAVNGLFGYDYGSPSIIAITDDGIWYTPTDAIIEGLTVSSITNPSGTTFQYNFSGSPVLTGVTVGDTFNVSDCTAAANNNVFTVTAVSSPNYIQVTNASGVAQTGAAGTAIVAKRFLHPTWDGAPAGAPEGTGSFSTTTFWSGDTLWDAVAAYPVLVVGNGLAAGAGLGGKFKIYYTGGALHYNTAVALHGATVLTLDAVTQHTARLWAASASIVNSINASGMDEPEDWDFATGSGIYVDSIGPGGERVTALASSRDILYVFKKNSIYKILGSDFLAANDGEVVGPISNVGVLSQQHIFKSGSKIFFTASTGGLWVIENDQVQNLNGIMRDDFFNLAGVIGFHEARNEMWFASETNSWVFDFDVGNWRKNPLSYPNCFFSTFDGKFLCGSSNPESTTAGYVYSLEDPTGSGGGDTKDYSGYFTSTLETAPTDFGNNKMEKRPWQLYIYGSSVGATVTVYFKYQTQYDAATILTAATNVSLPAKINFATSCIFTECAVKIDATRAVNIQGIKLAYIDVRERLR